MHTAERRSRYLPISDLGPVSILEILLWESGRRGGIIRKLTVPTKSYKYP